VPFIQALLATVTVTDSSPALSVTQLSPSFMRSSSVPPASASKIHCFPASWVFPPSSPPSPSVKRPRSVPKGAYGLTLQSAAANSSAWSVWAS